ncbi:hypothetical protein BKA93DRAFT_442868 [Sparassis latifolia]
MGLGTDNAIRGRPVEAPKSNSRQRRVFGGQSLASKATGGRSIVLPSTADEIRWNDLLLPDVTPIHADMTPYLMMSNAWTLRTDLAEMFTNNQWGVDVEDCCRVVFFGLYDSYADFLP